LNLADLVLDHPGSSRAVHDADGWHSWQEIRSQAAEAAMTLRQVGVGPGDRVVLARPGSAGFVAGYLGVLAAGAVAVPVNPLSPAPELAGELQAVDPAVVLASGIAESVLRSAAEQAGVTPTILVSETGGGSWEDAVGRAAGGSGRHHLKPHPCQGDDPAVLLFTSGTAGPPKPAVLTQANLLANLTQLQAVPGVEARPDDVGLAALPLFHVFGLNVALGLSLAAGAPLVIAERFDPEATAAQVRELQVTVLVGVPTVFAHWAVAGLSASGNGSGPSSMASVRLAVSGGAAISPGVIRDFEARSGVLLDQGYGLTEASPAVSTTVGAQRPRSGSVGYPLPGVEIRLVDESGSEALVGDPGEIWVRGPNVFAGYWAGDGGVVDAPGASDGWLRTGDVGVVDRRGALAIVDRRKDLIIVSGFNVYPAEVERVLAGCPGVAEAAVIGRPDDLAGEVVEAVVVASDPGRPPAPADVVAYCQASLVRYKCPTSVRLVDRLPRSGGGEVMRRKMRRESQGPGD